MGRQSRKTLVINIALVLLILCACLGGYRWYSAQYADGASAAALVHDADGNVWELSLAVDTELTVSTDLGTNVIRVENGEVWVDRADCPHQDCVEQGAISESGQMIICLPHELWIELVSVDTADGEGTAGAQGTQNPESTDGYDALSR